MNAPTGTSRTGRHPRRWVGRGAIALAVLGAPVLVPSIAHAGPPESPVCVAGTLYDLTRDGALDSGVLDGDGNGRVDQNAIDMDFDGVADLWMIDDNEDCVLDQGAQDLDGDRSADIWIVDTQQDGVFDVSYLDAVSNGLPDLGSARPITTGRTLVLQGEPFRNGNAADAGPFGQDILDALALAPRQNPAGSDYPGGATIGGVLDTASDAATIFAR
jgi:hypothetical protein